MSGRNLAFDQMHQQSSGGFGDILSNTYVRIGLYILVAIVVIYIILLVLRKYTTILDNKFGDFLGKFLPFFTKPPTSLISV